MAILSQCPTLLTLDLRTCRRSNHPVISASASAAARPQPRSVVVCSSISSGGNARGRPWWLPLFRFEPEPENDPAAAEQAPGAGGCRGDGDEAAPPEERAERRSRLTEEKAKILRREMRATQTWHDTMYHSVIASRLASSDDS